MNLAQQRKLVVLVPGYLGDPAKLASLKKLLQDQPQLAGAKWLDFDYRARLWSNRDPEEIARELGARIQAEVERDDDPPNEIILAGHSMGTTLLRRAFLNAKGRGATQSRQSWAEAVSRIVLMGAIGRGFSSKRLPALVRPLIPLAKLCRIGKMRRAVLIGADFVTRLRLDWIRFCASGETVPPVFHLLGTSDPRVLIEDVIDIEQFHNAIPIEIPGANHSTVTEPVEASRHLLIKAFVGDPSADREVAPSGADAVVFLLHGIRDSKECFDRVGDRLRSDASAGALGRNLEVMQPQYSRMSAPAFVSPWRRRRHIPWFVDQYAECLARNPKAQFFFAGHSNGTYILGESLKRMPGMLFERVYIGGSVLPADYPWSKVLQTRKQVGFLRSDRGSRDWPVGILSRALNRLGVKDIGGGGYDRFRYGGAKLAENLFDGGHSAMLDGDNEVEAITSYLLGGKPTQGGVSEEPHVPGWFRVGHKYGDVLLPLLLAGLLFLIGFGAWKTAVLLGWPLWGAALLGLGVVLTIWLVLERF